MEVLVGWLFFCGLAAFVASSKGRNPAGWFFIAVFASPLLAIIILLVLPDEAQKKGNERATKFQRLRQQKRDREEKEERKQLERERREERQQSQQLHAMLLSKLAAPAPQPRQFGPAVTPPASDSVEVPPPLPDEVPTDGWYVVVKGEKMGPLELGGLARLVTKEMVTGESLVWRKGYPGWTTVKSEKILVEAIKGSARKLK